MNKKVVLITLLLVFVVGMLAGCEKAKEALNITEPGEQPEDIKGEGVPVQFYNKHRTTIDFFVMFALFCAVAMLGLKRFGSEGAPAKGVAVAIGLALALAAMKAGFSPSFFIPFVKNALFLIIFFMIFMVVRASMGGEAWVGPFLIALALTFVAFNVTNIILDPDKKFDLAAAWSVPTATKAEDMKVDMARLQSDLNIMARRYGVTPTASFEKDSLDIGEEIEKRIAETEKKIAKADKISDEKKRAAERKKQESALEKLFRDLDALFKLKKEYSRKGSKYNTLLEGLQPTKPKVMILEGLKAAEGDSLTCQATSSYKKDTDTLAPTVTFKYQWYRGKNKIKQYTDKILPSDVTKEGESWICEATPSVAGVKGPRAKSDPIEIGSPEALTKIPGQFSVKIIPSQVETLPGKEIILKAEIEGGVKPYNFIWVQDEAYDKLEIADGKDTEEITMKITREGTYKISLKVIDSAGIKSVSDTIEIRIKDDIGGVQGIVTIDGKSPGEAGVNLNEIKLKIGDKEDISVDAGGRYKVDGLPVGSYTIEEDTKYIVYSQDTRVEIEIKLGEIVEADVVDLTKVIGNRIIGISVNDKQGVAIQTAEVKIQTYIQDLPVRVDLVDEDETDKYGSVLFEKGISTGTTYEILVTKDGYKPWRDRVRLKSNEPNLNLEITLEEANEFQTAINEKIVELGPKLVELNSIKNSLIEKYKAERDNEKLAREIKKEVNAISALGGSIVGTLEGIKAATLTQTNTVGFVRQLDNHIKKLDAEIKKAQEIYAK